MTCKDCIHFEICEIFSDQYGISKVYPSDCGFAKEKSCFIELPCKVGDKIFAIVRGNIIEDSISGMDVFQDEKGWYFRIRIERWSNYVIGTWNEDIFDTREEAEKKLEEMKR